MAKAPSLAKLTAKWRARLGLSHWTIVVGYADRGDMETKTNVGEVEWNAVRRTARIRILHPTVADASEFDFITDVEHTLVHELVHAVLGGVISEKADYAKLENTIDDITHALLTADRKIK